jgi:polyhydroxyalkanoate synthesis regulator phasin
MKKLLVMICMMFGCVFVAKATGEKSSKTKAVVTARAQHLSDQMIKQLRLNNYQAKKIREINLQVSEQVTAIEQQFAGDQQKVEALCKNVYAERDMFLEDVLSTVQYNDYFGDRNVYRTVDQKFMSSLNNQNAGNIASSAKADANDMSVSIN